MNRREEYLQKLRDPRWQKKRLEIMQRDNFACQLCFDNKQTLNVHHNYYRGNLEPWEYPPESLVTLCEECHSEETESRRQEEQLLLDTLRRIGFHSAQINSLAGSLFEQFRDQPTFHDRDEMKISHYLRFFDQIAEDVWQGIYERFFINQK